MRRYFADPYRGSVLRLSRDGLTEISQNGMSDYFRDELQKISNTLKSYAVENTTNTTAETTTKMVEVKKDITADNPVNTETTEENTTIVEGENND